MKHNDLFKNIPKGHQLGGGIVLNIQLTLTYRANVILLSFNNNTTPFSIDSKCYTFLGTCQTPISSFVSILA